MGWRHLGYDAPALEGGRFRSGALVLVGVAAVALGCGDSVPDPPGPLPAAVREIQSALDEGDVATVCSRMTVSAREQVGVMAHGERESCVRDLRQAVALIEKGGGFGDLSETEIEGGRRNGDKGTVSLALDGWTTNVPMTREAGEWKLDSFFGIPTRAALSRASAYASRVSPSAEKRAESGRELVVTGEGIDVGLLTAFGDLDFATCDFTFRSYVDQSGATLTHDLERLGPQGSACGDIEQCGTPSRDEPYSGINPGIPPPWKGVLRHEDDGGYVHTMQACFWTCIGFFEGTLTLRFARDGGRWRADDVHVGIGDNGLNMEGTFTTGAELEDLG
jgi:hypothetical protein